MVREEAPRPDWVRLEVAPFYFMPRYTGKGRAWVKAITRKAGSYLARERLRPDAELADMGIFAVRSDGLELQVDPEAGTFWLRHLDHTLHLAANAKQELRFPPSRFIGEYQAAKIEPEFEAVANKLFKLAIIVSGHFDWLDFAIEHGYAVVMARKNSPLAPFELIHPDQWHQFQPPRSSDGIALGPAGEQLFSPFVAPAGRRRVATTVDSKTACRRWLTDLMQRGQKDRPKAEYFAEAQAQWPNLSRLSFKEVWKEAIEIADAEDWRRAGRPRKYPLRNP